MWITRESLKAAVMSEVLKKFVQWLVLAVAIAVVVGSWRMLPAKATPSGDYEARQTKALESIAVSLKKLEKCK